MEKFDPISTALILIDLQEGILAYPSAPVAVADVKAAGVGLANAFRTAGALVVLTRVVYSPDFRDVLTQAVDRPLPGGAALPANWADFPSDLHREGQDIVVEKRNWGAFFGTGLDLQLRRRGIKTIVLGGIATNMGVESTAREAYERGYSLIFAEGAISSMGDEMHQFAMTTIFPLIGKVQPVDAILAGIS